MGLMFDLSIARSAHDRLIYATEASVIYAAEHLSDPDVIENTENLFRTFYSNDIYSENSMDVNINVEIIGNTVRVVSSNKVKPLFMVLYDFGLLDISTAAEAFLDDSGPSNKVKLISIS